MNMMKILVVLATVACLVLTPAFSMPSGNCDGNCGNCDGNCGNCDGNCENCNGDCNGTADRDRLKDGSCKETE